MQADGAGSGGLHLSVMVTPLGSGWDVGVPEAKLLLTSASHAESPKILRNPISPFLSSVISKRMVLWLRFAGNGWALLDIHSRWGACWNFGSPTVPPQKRIPRV